MNEVLLSNKFVLYPNKVEAEVTLDNTVLSIKHLDNKSKEPDIIDVDSIIGCHVVEGNQTTSVQWFISIFSYPLKTKLFKKVSRQRNTRSFGIASCYAEQDQKFLAEKWKNVIKHLISGRKLTSHEVDYLEEPLVKRFVVYINPFSGQGKSMQIFDKNVKPMFAESEIQHDVIQTECCGHAKELAFKLDLSKYDGIVVVSGDGLIHEIINGLMKRKDWEAAIKTPIGIVPGGSGNALAASINYSSNGLHPLPSSMLSSIFQICRGNVTELDIMSFELSDSRNEDVSSVIYSFLGFVIGLIADIDLESEHLRFLGQTVRTNLYAIMRIATLRKYQVTVSYLPIQNELSNKFSDTPPEGKKAMNKPENFSNENSSVKRNSLVSLSQPVPSSWKVISGDFIQITGLNISHLSEDICAHPKLKLNDGKITLAMLEGSGNRKTILKAWDLMEKGIGWADVEHVQIANCRAFRIDPTPQFSQIETIDGEKIPFGSLQCQIHPGLARVFGKSS